MAVPDYQTFMRPLLLLAADGMEHGINNAIGELAEEFGLSEADRSQLLPSGLGSVLANRVSWAKTYLMKAGALEKTRRAHFCITDRGRDLLREYPDGISSQILRKYPEFIAFQQPADEPAADANTTVRSAQPNEVSPETPEEAIQRSENEVTRALQEDLLSRIHELSPTFFERLVVDLIVAMGYGGSREYVVQAIGKSGDQGIDGIVNEDVLGLDRVYIQAKRYAADDVIGRERFSSLRVRSSATQRPRVYSSPQVLLRARRRNTHRTSPNESSSSMGRC